MMNNEINYAIEEIGNGMVVVDYTGGRGQFGAAYAGSDGIWRDQPASVSNPFPSEAEASKWADTQSFQRAENVANVDMAEIDATSLEQAEKLIPTGGKTVVLKFKCTKSQFFDLAMWGRKYGTDVVLPIEFVEEALAIN
jgi:hypothetical protein